MNLYFNIKVKKYYRKIIEKIKILAIKFGKKYFI